MTKELVEYVAAQTKLPNRAIARRLGVVHTTLASQLASDDTPVSVVIRICREFGVPLAPAFIAAGYLTEEEAKTFSCRLTLGSFSDLELSKEMLRRVAAGTAGPLITDPTNDDVLNDVLREVEDARQSNKRPDFDLAAEEREDRTPGELDGDDHGKTI